MKKLFVCAMALAAFVSCSKDDVQGPALDSANKSVSITIENTTTTRAAYTGGETTAQAAAKVAQASELKILFANDGGTVLKELSLVGGNSWDDTHTGGTTTETQYVPAADNAEGEGTYTWHNVPWDVTRIAVVRYEAGDLGEGVTSAVGLDLEDNIKKMATDETLNVARSADQIVLYVDADLKDSGATHRVGDIIYHVWDANVTVAPALARFEINMIKCADLGVHDGSTTGSEYSFDELDILSMVWTDEKGDTYAVPVTSKTWRGATTSMVGTLYGQYTAAAEGKVSDKCTDNTTRTEPTEVAPESGVWSWNIDPVETQFKSMVVDINAYAYDYTLSNNKTPLYIKGLNTAENASEDNITFVAGNVYNMDIEFLEQHIADEDQLCVKVTVSIDSWTVNPVFPVFGK
ncbi:MAG: hypothetical protein IIX32_08035 [Alistipes sp.]|nr:hypothetical protein [Alistipes sp.]